MYFEDLQTEDLQALAQSSIPRIFVAGQSIFLEGEKATGLWIVEKGRIKISKMISDGNEHILHILGDGDTFNDIATLDAGHNPANAIALSDASARIIPSASITGLIETNGQFALKVVHVLATTPQAISVALRELEASQAIESLLLMKSNSVKLLCFNI